LAKALSQFTGKLRHLSPSWRSALLSWAGVRLGLGLWAAWIWLQGLMPGTTGFFYQNVAPILTGWQGAVLGMWQRWDGVYYQSIAEGYYTQGYQTAFFPVYPLLARALAQASGLSPLAALLVISALAALGCLVLLRRIARELYSEETANRTVLAAVLFPSAFFFFAVYPQSLALLWMLLAYDQARREHWLAAGLAGLLAGLTHGTVLPLAAMLAVMAWKSSSHPPSPLLPIPGEGGGKESGDFLPPPGGKKSPRLNGHSPFPSGPRPPWGKGGRGLGKSKIEKLVLRPAALLSVAGLPLLGTGIFLAWRIAMGFPAMDALLMSDWNRVLSTPWDTLWALVKDFPTLVMGNWLILLNTAVLGLAIWAVVRGWIGSERESSSQLPLELNVYQTALLLYLLCTRVTTDPLLGLNRYILVMFPLYLVIGSIQLNRVGRGVLFALGVLGSLGLSAMFFMWKWIG
jgi:hypothetical protein